MSGADLIFREIDARREEILGGLMRLLEIPSVSADPARASDVRRCAEFLAAELRSAGFQSSVEETGGHPAVFAAAQAAGAAPTVLFYGHYDVQPAEPLDKWTTPPFSPAVRGGAIYARGASDDKGPLWAHIQALRLWREHGGLPVNVIVLLEGEEEIGSPHLRQFLERNRDRLRADVAVLSDTAQFARGMPAITCGLRGLLYMEIVVRGAAFDLHSGSYGGAVPNPANVLVELLASLHDAQGRVNIPGFYDDVAPLSQEERRQWSRLPFDEDRFLRELGLEAGAGEAGYSTLERRWARPTCDINGLTAGYQGPGAKTVIPATASAKVSMRLVPDQDPDRIQEAFERTLRQRCPAGVRLEISRHSAAPACLTRTDSPFMRRAMAAVTRGFGVEPVLIRGGGSVPVVGMLKEVLGVDALLAGFSLPDDREHSPDEKFDLESLRSGMRTAAALYEELGRR